MNFNEIAETWDTERRINRAKEISNFIKSRVTINKDMTMLEFGCGTGLITFNFVDDVTKMIGYDSSEKMLEVFNEKIIKLKTTNVYSTSDLQSQNNQINLVISSMVFHHIIDINTSLKEIFDVLKSNGDLFIVDLDLEDGSFHRIETEFYGHNGFDREKFKSYLIESGFAIMDCGTVLNDVKNVNGIDIPYSLFYVHGRKRKV